MKNIGLCFSKELQGVTPLSHITEKLPVYLRLLNFMESEGWGVHVLTRKTYIGGGIFKGGWRFEKGNFTLVNDNLKMDLVYDRTGGINFPPEDAQETIWINRRDFKILAWDKWGGYKTLEKYMAKTLLLENEDSIPNVLPKLKTDWVVLKPVSGLKGMGIFIGPKDKALDFKFDKKFTRYVAQEFIDTSGGIPGIASGMHDLRIVVNNGQIVWSHVRAPVNGTYLANAAQGGNLSELDIKLIPSEIKNIVSEIGQKFYKDYDNPIFSVDFGVGKNERPYIFEINDQMGFPKWDMKSRDVFLKSLIENFKSKLRN